MHERHINKAALDRKELAVKADLSEVRCYRACEGISRKRTRVIAEHVARKLIAEQDKGKTGTRSILPVHERTCCGKVVIIQKIFTNDEIKVRVGGKPALVPGVVVFFVVARSAEPE